MALAHRIRRAPRIAGSDGEGLVLGFHGHLVDPASGLVSMRARWYRPEWGQFLSPDPIGLAGGNHAFAFVGGRPSLDYDPFGLAPRDPRPGAVEAGEPESTFLKVVRAPFRFVIGAVKPVVEGVGELALMAYDFVGIAADYGCTVTAICDYTHHPLSAAGRLGEQGVTPSIIDVTGGMAAQIVTAPARFGRALWHLDFEAAGAEVPSLLVLYGGASWLARVAGVSRGAILVATRVPLAEAGTVELVGGGGLAGGGGFDMALGLARHEGTGSPFLLRNFARRVGAKTYADIYGDWWPGSMEALESNIGGALSGANRLHFNLDQLSLGRFQEFTRNPAFTTGNITNWELNAILRDPTLLQKTIVYGPEGAVVPPPALP